MLDRLLGNLLKKPSKYDIVIAEEQARIQAQRQPPQQVTQPIPRMKNGLIDTGSRTFKGKLVLLRVNNPGHIAEILLKTSSSSYDIHIETGTDFKVHRSYTSLSDIADYSNTISAFQDSSGDYIFHIVDIYFQELNLYIEASSAITLSNTYIKWREEV